MPDLILDHYDDLPEVPLIDMEALDNDSINILPNEIKGDLVDLIDDAIVPHGTDWCNVRRGMIEIIPGVINAHVLVAARRRIANFINDAIDQYNINQHNLVPNIHNREVLEENDTVFGGITKNIRNLFKTKGYLSADAAEMHNYAESSRVHRTWQRHTFNQIQDDDDFATTGRWKRRSKRGEYENAETMVHRLKELFGLEDTLGYRLNSARVQTAQDDLEHRLKALESKLDQANKSKADLEILSTQVSAKVDALEAFYAAHEAEGFPPADANAHILYNELHDNGNRSLTKLALKHGIIAGGNLLDTLFIPPVAAVAGGAGAERAKKNNAELARVTGEITAKKTSNDQYIATKQPELDTFRSQFTALQKIPAGEFSSLEELIARQEKKQFDAGRWLDAREALITAGIPYIIGETRDLIGRVLTHEVTKSAAKWTFGTAIPKLWNATGKTMKWFTKVERMKRHNEVLGQKATKLENITKIRAARSEAFSHTMTGKTFGALKDMFSFTGRAATNTLIAGGNILTAPVKIAGTILDVPGKLLGKDTGIGNAVNYKSFVPKKGESANDSKGAEKKA